MYRMSDGDKHYRVKQSKEGIILVSAGWAGWVGFLFKIN